MDLVNMDLATMFDDQTVAGPADPFLLPGDEQTWDLEDWSWDTYNLSALPKDPQPAANSASACCQALKRRRLSNGLGPNPADVAVSLQHMPGVSMGMHMNRPGPTLATGMGASCCSFQIPPMHMPLGHNSMPPVLMPGGLSIPMACPSTNGFHAQLADIQRRLAVTAQANSNGYAASLPPLPPLSQSSKGFMSPVLDFDEGSGSEGEGLGNGAGKGGRGSKKSAQDKQLTPATFRGNLDEVVRLSDTCTDEAARGSCQVGGCAKDLSGLKEYHQRYRICEVHIKLPQVLKDGRLQRFCQQCGRFHDLAAFDENRKSCRDQLSKHNARRRRRAAADQQARSKGPAGTNTADAPDVEGSTAAPAIGGSEEGGGPARAATPVPGTSGPVGGLSGDVGRLLAQLVQNPGQLHALRLVLGVQTHAALPPLRPFAPEPAAKVGGVASGLMAGTSGAVAGGLQNAAKLEAICADQLGVPEALPAGDPPCYGLAREVANANGMWAPSYESEHKTLRISMKLFNCTPADLPADLKQQVTSWLATAPAAMEGSIRPGCVFLTLHLLLEESTYRKALTQGMVSLLEHLRSRTGCRLWNQGMYAIQMEAELALVTHGRLTAYYREAGSRTPSKIPALEGPALALLGGALAPPVSGAQDRNSVDRGSTSGMGSSADITGGPGSRQERRMYPSLASVRPLCVAVPALEGAEGVVVELAGRSLDAQGAELIVRVHGSHYKVPFVALGPGGKRATATLPLVAALLPHMRHASRNTNAYAPHAAHTTHAHAGQPSHAHTHVGAACGRVAGAPCGVAWLEVARGAWLSAPRPLLVVDDPCIASEVQQLLEPGARFAMSPAQADALIVDLGMVLAHAGGAAQECMMMSGWDHSTVALKARRLLLFACDMGWAAVAGRVLPLASAHCSCAAEVVEAVHAAPPSVPAYNLVGHVQSRQHQHQVHEQHQGHAMPRPVPTSRSMGCVQHQGHAQQPEQSHEQQGHQQGQQQEQQGHEQGPELQEQEPERQLEGTELTLGAHGLSLLHRVVRSGSLKLLQGVLHWGEVAGYKWRADRAGPGGITPLHLAALQEDPRLLLALLECAPPGAFTRLAADDGTTPFHLAFQMGYFTLDALARLLGTQQLLPAPGHEASHLPSDLHASVPSEPLKEVVQVSESLLNPQELLHPCGICASTLPPLLLSIAAACADCGIRVPCLGPLSRSPQRGGAGKAATGHDVDHCAGCSVAGAAEEAGTGLGLWDGGHGSGDEPGHAEEGGKRSRSEWEAEEGPDVWGGLPGMHSDTHTSFADQVNNSMGGGVPTVRPRPQQAVALPSRRANQHMPMCDHTHGSVFSITGLCQGCHSNRVLAVM